MRYRLAILALYLLGAFASESAWANRYYSPETGRFISRDPIGYEGGLGVYEYVSSAPTFYYDSIGLQVSIKFQDILKIPYSEATLTVPGKIIAGAALPIKLTGECECKCCGDPTDPKAKWKLECTVAIDFHIYIDPARMKDGWTTENTYGHEQKHVQKMQEQVKAEVEADAKKAKVGECVYQGKDKCDAAKQAVANILGWAAQRGAKLGSGHSDDPGNRDKGKPASTGKYPPIEGTNVPGNKAAQAEGWPTSAALQQLWGKGTPEKGITGWGLSEGSVQPCSCENE